jgi:hypothetical protein
MERNQGDLCRYFPPLFTVRDAVPLPLPEKDQLVFVVKPDLTPSDCMTWCYIKDAKTGQSLGLVPAHTLLFVDRRKVIYDVIDD